MRLLHIHATKVSATREKEIQVKVVRTYCSTVADFRRVPRDAARLSSQSFGVSILPTVPCINVSVYKFRSNFASITRLLRIYIYIYFAPSEFCLFQRVIIYVDYSVDHNRKIHVNLKDRAGKRGLEDSVIFDVIVRDVVYPQQVRISRNLFFLFGVLQAPKRKREIR